VIGEKGCASPIAAYADARLFTSYNGLIKTPKYVGGYFYWYGLQDMIPSSRPAVTDLIKAIPKT
jgi:hypothetical protein